MKLSERGSWSRRAGAVLALTLLAAVAGFQPAAAAADPPPITIASSTVTPQTIVGGSGGTQTITLSRPAPAGGTSVWVHYDNVYRETTNGGRVVVPAGQTSVTFPFQAAAPQTTRTGTILAQVSGTRLTPIATFTHQAADPATRAVSELRFDRPAALHGTRVTGTVVLKQPAPAGGLAVSLWSNTSYSAYSLRVPQFVTVPEGRTSATFEAIAVAEALGMPPAAGIVRPSADLGTSLVTGEVVVVPRTFALGGRTDDRDSGSLVVGIGDTPNPSGTVVSLRADRREVQLPAQVTVPAGQPGVAIPFQSGGLRSFSVTATWNGQSITQTIFMPPV